MFKGVFIQKVNYYTKNKISFLFLVDFEQHNLEVFPLSELKNHNIFYAIDNRGNFPKTDVSDIDFDFKTKPLSYKQYSIEFNSIKEQIKKGNTYLLNLTFKNQIEFKNARVDLMRIIQKAKAPYKLFYKNKFISFSPETFIKIKKNKIFTYPMKGTVDASIDNAKKVLLSDIKETQEHNTIVDLMRNDLAIVASDIKITKFKYLDKINKQNGSIYQMSSEIQGELPNNWKDNLGELLLKLFPAGSISGAPKPKTIEIIKQTENYKRGFYTGVFGVFDGMNLDSAVLIRFIEKEKDAFYYKSGGGITYLSELNKEYHEIAQKIYIPI